MAQDPGIPPEALFGSQTSMDATLDVEISGRGYLAE
jgi:hypothetical protein